MDIDTIVDNIKYSMASGNEGRINITEKSFLLDLLNEDSINSKEYKPHVPQFDMKSRFPLSGFVLKCLMFIIEGFIWCFYRLARGIRRLLLGKKADKDLSTSPRLNFVFFMSIIITYVVILAIVLIFFVKSILLFNPNSGVNEQGAFSVPQDCGRENYIFLFNTATCWANSGIKVLEGDEVIVSASGSFFGSIYEMKYCAERNEKPKYTRNLILHYNQQDEKDSIDTTPLCMFHAKGVKFGSLLLQVTEDGEDLVYDSDSIHDRIRQLDFSDSEKPAREVMRKSGMLYFAVNDIYLSETVVNKIKADRKYQNYLNFKTFVIKEKKTIGIDTIDYKQLSEIIPPDYWFRDNVGEILLNITIIRRNFGHDTFVPTIVPRTYRWIEMKINSSKWSDYLLLLTVLSLLLVGDYYLGIYLRKKQGNGK